MVDGANAIRRRGGPFWVGFVSGSFIGEFCALSGQKSPKNWAHPGRAGIWAGFVSDSETNPAQICKAPPSGASFRSTTTHFKSSSRPSSATDRAATAKSRTLSPRMLALRARWALGQTPSSIVPLEQNHPPVPLTHATSRVRHLPLAGLAAQLFRRLDDEEQAALTGVARREPTAVGVGGEGSAEAQLAVGDERAALALGAEAEVLERDEQHVGEGVVELADVDVGRA